MLNDFNLKIDKFIVGLIIISKFTFYIMLTISLQRCIKT